MKKIYIASPYTKGDVALNVRTQIDAAHALMSMGYLPFWPLHSHFQHMVHPRPYEDWLKADLEWVRACDMVLRLPGDSAGADREVALAEELGIPVCRGLDEFAEWRKNEIRSRDGSK